MSKGMWTKHFSVEGKVYYYNAALNKSQWSPPSDAIVHEAVNAKPPPKKEVEEGEEETSATVPPGNAAMNPIQMPVEMSQLGFLPPGMMPMSMLPPMPPFPPGMPMPMPMGMPMPFPEHGVPMPPLTMPQMMPQTEVTTSTAPIPTEGDIQALKNQQAALDIQAKIDQALMQKTKEISNSKRFKKSNSNPAEEEQYSAYLKQKSDLENLSGSKGDDASKWLVR